MPVPGDLTPSSLFSHQDDGNNDIHWSRRCGEATVCYVIITLCVHAKSLWSFLTLCDPMDYSPPGSSVHGDSPGKNTGVGCHALLQGIFLTQGSSPHLLHRQQVLYHERHLGSPLLPLSPPTLIPPLLCLSHLLAPAKALGIPQASPAPPRASGPPSGKCVGGSPPFVRREEAERAGDQGARGKLRKGEKHLIT